MKKIIFHVNQLCERGTTVATRDMAFWSQKLIPNLESVIMYRTDHEFGNNQKVKEALEKDGILLQPYSVNANEIEDIVRSHNPDIFYRLYAGGPSARQPSSGARKDFNHAIFPGQFDDKTDAYISEWLSIEMFTKFKKRKPFLNHIVNLPEPTESSRNEIRSMFRVPDSAFVFGRLGGYDSFDIGFVREAVLDIANAREDVYFFFANTDPRGMENHPRIKFFETIVDMQTKSNFISACDAMIHARQRGETFGIACAEFMQQKKPVLTYRFSPELAHIDPMVLSNAYNFWNLTYTDKDDVILKANQLADRSVKSNLTFNPERIINNFKPEKVIEEFCRLTGI